MDEAVEGVMTLDDNFKQALKMGRDALRREAEAERERGIVVEN